MLTTHKRLMLLNALLEEYPDEVITGYLVDTRVSCNSVVGHVFKAWGYANGELLVSGAIKAVVQYENRWLIKTLDRDCFLIVNFASGGRQALMHLIDLYQTARLLHSQWCLQ